MSSEDVVFYGEVVFFLIKQGYGFIKPTIDGPDIFVHFSDINIDGFKLLKAGQKVTYTIGQNKDGKPIAKNINVKT